MQTLTENLLQQGLGDRILTQAQLERALGVSAAARYGLVNRALKADELVQVRRGLYVVSPRLRTEPVHPFALAQAIVHGSYISFETALSYHGWIPESVAVVASVVPGRKSLVLDHPTLGGFSFHPLALNRTSFLEAVEGRQFGSQAALVARPLRALLDLVALRKLEWQGLEFVTEGLRIDSDGLASIGTNDLASLEQLYKQRRPNVFLRRLAGELQL
ncbi:hypothetical protein GCM10011487_51930 [Steroidobacter agaridevorans]|uniref:AbiEi antitoxin N-terminal domain-containing protein n=1 Tax=Steroidobacter agaridevorans TaxID=2695856 RepID=A0A829YK33_9GAMM|nr:type IV toxin-antitoxin system AbiEi family antitoxin domain-containing protein [Steroidobacter agaridevorans]GFE83193.1 hypothetical protein GCM10011487_51930 [Steroidobacter agaridevorans]